MFRTLFLSISMFGYFSAYAESHHHEREKVKIEIEDRHHHKQKNLGGMLFDGGIQFVENNTYLFTAAGASLFLYAPLKFKRRFNDAQIVGIAAGLWLGGGMITRSFMRAIMSQRNIKKI